MAERLNSCQFNVNCTQLLLLTMRIDFFNFCLGFKKKLRKRKRAIFIIIFLGSSGENYLKTLSDIIGGSCGAGAQTQHVVGSIPTRGNEIFNTIVISL